MGGTCAPGVTLLLALTDLLISAPMETLLPQFPLCLHPGPCTLSVPPAAALVEIKRCPNGKTGWGRVAQSSCFLQEADTQASPSATTCGFAPSLQGPAHLTAIASTLLFLFPLLLRLREVFAVSAPRYVLFSFVHTHLSLPLWSLCFT